jgi:hypothetical protein
MTTGGNRCELGAESRGKPNGTRRTRGFRVDRGGRRFRVSYEVVSVGVPLHVEYAALANEANKACHSSIGLAIPFEQMNARAERIGFMNPLFIVICWLSLLNPADHSGLS